MNSTLRGALCSKAPVPSRDGEVLYGIGYGSTVHKSADFLHVKTVLETPQRQANPP